jgi:opacity protein-like surface antigen
LRKIMTLAVLLVLCASFAQTEENVAEKYGFNVIFGGGFNMMKSWENYPEIPGNLDEIPGAALIGMRMEYDFGQHFDFPEFSFFAGSDAAITQIGNSGHYSETGAILGKIEYSHTTFISEFGLVKKFEVAQDFLLYIGGSFVIQNMDIKPSEPESVHSIAGAKSSNGFKGLGGLNYRMGKAWFFDLQMSYTGGMSALKDGDGEEIGSHFPDTR